MSESPPTRPRPAPNDSAMDDLLAETRLLRRKVNFWQHTAWLLVGGVIIVGTVIWQRGELRRRECFQSLEYYADLAQREQLRNQHPDILEQQWQSLDKGMAKITPIHYDLIVQNWFATPKADESLPLAVCRESHFLTFSRGRHVLVRDTRGQHIQWRSEAASEPVVEQAAKDNRTK